MAAFKYLLALVVLVVTASGCANLPLYQNDYHSSLQEHQQQPYRYYDPETKVRYRISNDDSLLYISLSTESMESLAKIMFAGLRTYIDTTEKRRTDTYLHFPLPMGESTANAPVVGADGDRLTMAERYDGSALWVSGERSFAFNYKFKDNNFDLELEDVDGRELVIHMAIPLQRIYPNGIPSSPIFSVGFVAEPFDRKKKLGEGDGNIGVTGGVGGGMGGMGGMGAAVGSPGMNAPGMMGGMNGMGMRNPTVPVNVSSGEFSMKIWMNVRLAEAPTQPRF